LTDTVEKRFGSCAILIQEKPRTENIDSRNCLPGEKSCILTIGHRLFNGIDSKRKITSNAQSNSPSNLASKDTPLMSRGFAPADVSAEFFVAAQDR
jgi:hypothetical protein